MGRHRGLGPVVAVVLLLAGCTTAPSTAPATAPARDQTPATPVGLPVCRLSALPPQVDETVADIHAGGPFAFPRNDGVVFGNREHVLPSRRNGYYHEYTVVTPGSRTRGARRIVTGGTPLTDPPAYFYTGDHYDTFCQVDGADR